uniref:CRACD like n=1 Tax=Nomascus leucogenys TaxID=61853 RepID=G1QNH0_NOMLE
MISTRVMDIKLREAAEGLGEDSTGKKKSKFKTFKKFFGKKKRKESPSSTGSSTWKQSQTRNEVIAIESGPVENVCDRIKALQLKIQCNVKMGPPPPPGGLPAKRGEDAGMSSEDDGLPRSPPEMSLLHDVGPGTTIKVCVVSPDHVSDSTVSARISNNSLAPVADFSYPPESSSCLDNSAAKHKLQVKPRNQRSSKMRRLSSRAQSESLSDLTCTPEEEENEEKPLLEVSPEESPSSGQQDVAPDRGPEPGPPASLPPPGGARARRARLQHCSALTTSRCPFPTAIPEGDTTPPETDPAATSEAPSAPDGPEHSVLKEAEPTPPVLPDEEKGSPGPAPEPERGAETEPERGAETEPERIGTEPSAAPAPSPPAPKSCLKHRTAAASEGPTASSPLAAVESPQVEAGPGSLDAEAAAPERPKAERAEAPPAGAERAAPERKAERGGAELRSAKKFSVSSCRGRPRPGVSRPLERASGRVPLARSSPVWRSEAALDDLQGLPEPQHAKPGPRKPAECGPQDLGDRAASPAGPRKSPQEAAAAPSTREACPAAQEPAPSEDRNPFPVKLRSTSLSLKYRDGASQEAKGVKRYSAEVRLERSLTVLPKEEKCPLGMAPALRGARAPSDQGKGKARPPEPLSSKPPLPRKPLLQSFTLPHQPAPPDAGPGERDPRKESRTAEKRPLRKGAEKSLPPAATGPGADGQPVPPWITITRQKRKGTLDQPPNQEDKPGARTLKSEPGKQAKVPERAQEPVKQADFVRSKSFLITPVKPTVDRKQGAKLNLKEGLQRGISLSHQNLAQSAVIMEKELHQLKRASYASTDQPSWMELARKKSQAWSDMPQIIK